MKKLFSYKLSFFVLAVILFWAKTYLSYQTEFNLGVKGTTQEILLLINPFSSAIVFLGLALFAKGRKSAIIMLIIDFVMTFILYANILFYRFFDDFLTFPNIKQSGNVGNMGDGIFSIMAAHDIFYFVDFIILIAVLIWRPELKGYKMKKRFTSLVI